VTSAASLVLAAPAVALVIASFWVGWLSWLGLVVGVAIGALVLWQGVVRGGAVLDRRWPEVLSEVSAR
jgi:ABC-2 type transport system permease protein